MNKIRIMTLAGLALLAGACATADPEWIRPREGAPPESVTRMTEDRPPGTCQRHTDDGIMVTVPCSEIRTTITGGTVGAAADETKPQKRETIPNGECYIRLGDGTKRPILCEHAGTAWQWFRSADSEVGREERQKSWNMR